MSPEAKELGQISFSVQSPLDLYYLIPQRLNKAIRQVDSDMRCLIFLIFLSLSLSGCDPLLSLQGSFWPPWIMSMVCGLVLTAILSNLLSKANLAEFLGPPVLIYPSLWALLTFTSWLVAFSS